MGGILLPFVGSGAAQGSATPSQLPNLSLWYNASASSTTVNNVATNNFQAPVVNGTSISKWIDLQKVAGDSNVNGGTGREPNYATPIQNGLGAVLYTSANQDNLDINPTSWAQNLPGFTIYVVARPTSTPATSFPLTVSDTSLGIWWNGTNWSAGITAGNRGSVNLTNDTTKFHQYGMVFDGTQTGNAARLQLRYDKSVPTLTFIGTIPATTSTPSYFYFGGNNRSGGAGGALAGTYMAGYIGEVLIWTRALSASEIASVEYYISNKWGI